MVSSEPSFASMPNFASIAPTLTIQP
jgi:hypothetical protein